VGAVVMTMPSLKFVNHHSAASAAVKVLPLE
jgi:hypothetical protein